MAESKMINKGGEVWEVSFSFKESLKSEKETNVTMEVDLYMVERDELALWALKSKILQLVNTRLRPGKVPVEAYQGRTLPWAELVPEVRLSKEEQARLAKEQLKREIASKVAAWKLANPEHTSEELMLFVMSLM